MRVLIKTFLLLLTLSLFQSCVFPKAVSAYFSKEMCSCLFVVGRSETLCADTAKTFIDVSSYKVDMINKVVSSSFLAMSTKAKFTQDRFGCQIVE